MLSERQIFQQWLPLLSIWFLMALDLGIASSLVARDINSEINLAAFNISFAIGLFLESPIIMMLVVPIKLVDGPSSYKKISYFCYSLAIAMTSLMLFLLIPGIFDFWAHKLLLLDKDVASLVYRCLWFFVPWAGMIGYRRFYQGIIIKSRKNHKIIYGTIVRLLSLGSFSFTLLKFSSLSSAEAVSLSLNIAVILEALTVRFFAQESVKFFQNKEEDKELSFQEIMAFYFPLVLTALIALSVQPLANLSASYGNDPIRSLAVLPVINAFVFLFKSVAISYQEVILSLAGDNQKNLDKLLMFATKILCFLVVAYSAVAFTPLGLLWFKNIVGLSQELTKLALPAVQLMVFMPLLSVAFCWQKSLLMYHGRTKYIGYAAILEILIIVALLFLLIVYSKQEAVMSIMYSLLFGRVLAVGYLVYLRRKEIPKLASNEIV